MPAWGGFWHADCKLTASKEAFGVQTRFIPETIAQQATQGLDRVRQAIRHASERVGVDFDYLLQKASQESSLDPTAKAKTSSATGLFQFIEQTWLRSVKQHGEKYGLGELASKITIGSDGVARVGDAADRKNILELRKDPTLSACMAAELTKQNCYNLKTKVGGEIGSTELYLAHFLGAGGAANFLEAYRTNPQAKAADFMPTAAKANPSVFYDKSGKPRSLASIYDRFAKKFDGAAPIQVASVVPPEQTLAASFSSDTVISYTPSFTGGLKYDSPSLFSTMLLAQMPVHEWLGEAERKSSDDKREKAAA